MILTEIMSFDFSNIFIVLVIIIAFAIRFSSTNEYKKKNVPQLDLLKSNYEKGLPDEIKAALEKYFVFYRNLHPNEKIRFERRTAAFYADKVFLDENRNELDDGLALMVSASAVQLTFGMKDFLLLHFRRVKVFPRPYSMPMIPTTFKGHVTEDGSVFLAWDSFAEGYSDPQDGTNLGLHEWTHALEVNNHFYNNQKFRKDFHDWEVSAIEEMKKMRAGQSKFLRSYGMQNEHEMFSVCVEFFFERTEEFATRLPTVYEEMKTLLNQNPLKKEDPVVEKDFNDHEIFVG